MRTRLRILNKEITFPNICPNHPDKLANIKIRVAAQVIRNPFEKHHMNKTPVTPFSYDEKLFVPVCEKCAKKFNLYKQYSKYLAVVGLLGIVILVLLANFAPSLLDKLNNIWPTAILSLFSCIGIAWGLGYLANRVPRISPLYKGEKGIDVDIYCEEKYLEIFLKINCCKEKGFFDI
jgi:hypothetical protein